jgi:hypothetical protein
MDIARGDESAGCGPTRRGTSADGWPPVDAAVVVAAAVVDVVGGGGGILDEHGQGVIAAGVRSTSRMR